jgi:three-Cys-motif partner protein
MFLDPFGMHINWSSLERFANTKSDVWILLPTAVIVNRLLLKNGDINVRKLTTFFGMKETEIRDYFYVHTGQLSAFSEEPDEVVKVTDPIGKIAKLYIARLGTIWKHVTENPLVLKTSNNRPLFHLVFASNNRSAMNIANSIISHIY